MEWGGHGGGLELGPTMFMKWVFVPRGKIKRPQVLTVCRNGEAQHRREQNLLIHPALDLLLSASLLSRCRGGKRVFTLRRLEPVKICVAWSLAGWCVVNSFWTSRLDKTSRT